MISPGDGTDTRGELCAKFGEEARGLGSSMPGGRTRVMSFARGVTGGVLPRVRTVVMSAAGRRAGDGTVGGGGAEGWNEAGCGAIAGDDARGAGTGGAAEGGRTTVMSAGLLLGFATLVASSSTGRT